MKYTKKQIQESIKHWEAVLEKLNAADITAKTDKVAGNPLELPSVKQLIDMVEDRIVKASDVGKYKCSVDFSTYGAKLGVDLSKAKTAIIKYFEDCGFKLKPNPRDDRETWICWNTTEDQLKESEHKPLSRDEIYARTQAARARMAENCEDTK